MTAPFDYFVNDEGDEFTELVDAAIDRVDMVDKAASGLRFLISKSAVPDGSPSLMPAAFVRDLISKAKDSPQQPIFDANGRLVGLTDPANIRPVVEPSSAKETDPAKVEADRQARDAATDEELTPAHPDTAGTATEDVLKAVAKAGGLRNAAERAVAARAVSRIAEAERTMSPAGLEATKLHAVGDAHREIQRLRASGQSGVVRKGSPTGPFREGSLSAAVFKTMRAESMATKRRRLGKG